MRVGVIGINHKLANLSLRESLAKACEKQFGQYLHDDHIFILLSTCNRTEIYFCSDDLAAIHSYLLVLLKILVKEDFDQKLYSYFSYNCFLHLSRVVAGLDSAIVAETEIQGQVKKTYEQAAQNKRLPKEMHYLFQKTLKIGKLIRSEYALGRGIPDLEHAIFNRGAAFFKKPEEKKILFLGASEINQKIVGFFKRKMCQNMTLCNRTKKTGETMANHHSMAYIPWEHFNRWQEYDWIIFGTKSKEHLITGHNLPQLEKKKLLIDLCVPRNVDPYLVTNSKIELCDIDQLNHSLNQRKENMQDILVQAEKRVAKETCKQMYLFRNRERKSEIQAISKVPIA